MVPTHCYSQPWNPGTCVALDGTPHVLQEDEKLVFRSITTFSKDECLAVKAGKLLLIVHSIGGTVEQVLSEDRLGTMPNFRKII